jgi:hypothetical protein
MGSDKGWIVLLNTRKYHYFDSEQKISLCGRWMYLGERSRLDDTNHEHVDNCKACSEAKLKLDTKAQKEQPR